MKKFTLIILLIAFCILNSSAQTPQHYYHTPANVGVNNIFFNDGICQKFIFIYTQAELAAMTASVTGAFTFDSVYFRSNTAASMTITNLEIIIGHSTLPVPVANFAANFNLGAPQLVFNVASYNYTTLPGTWNVPADQWSGIPIIPFAYNGTDNLTVQIRYSTCTYPDPFYAYNGGAPIVQYAASNLDTVASATTARPMFGFSAGAAFPVSNFTTTSTSICPGTCIDFTDLSLNNPVSWQWYLPGGVPSLVTDSNPQNICYENQGTYDVSLITFNAAGSDTLVISNYITVFPLPQTPTIIQSGDTLISSQGFAVYQWFFGSDSIVSATNYFYVATQSGNYNLAVTDSNGCTVGAGILNVIASSPTTALPEGEGVCVFPNPLKDFIAIKNIPADEKYLLEIFNAHGETLQRVTLSGVETQTVHIKLSPGIYFLKLTGWRNTFSEKLIIQ
jgi:PKD repeat protein